MTRDSLTRSLSYEKLVEVCTGARIKIPFLHELAPAWKAEENHQYDDTVEQSVDDWRQNWLTSASLYKRSLQVNSTFLASTVTPEATISKMTVFALFITWLFAWDDAVDFGEVDEGDEQRELLRVESIDCIRKSLTDGHAIQEPADIAPNCTLAQSFYNIGLEVRESTTLTCKPITRLFCDTLCDYVEAVVKVHSQFENEVIFGIDEFVALRLHTSGIYPTIALGLISQDVNIPQWLLDHPLVKKMMKHITLMIAFDNDIFSAKNEVKCKHMDNMIPLLVYHREMTLQEAVDHCCDLIRDSYLACLEIEPKLLQIGAEHDILDQVQRFLRCCRNQRTGLVNWAYTVKRYADFRPSEGKKYVEVILGE